MTLTQIINAIYPLPQSSFQKLSATIEEVNFSKGYLLIRADQVEKNIYFIKKGIVRAYASTPEQNITFWFGAEGEAIISMKSYVHNQKGYEDVELLEDCTLYKLNTSGLKTLYQEDIHLANWGRKFAEQELLLTEERLISRQFSTAKARYEDLLQNKPNLIQRVQLGHIASYLGITQVSLSRIRAEI